MADPILRKTLKYRLYPTAAQVFKLEAHLAICCELYNAALQERRDAWKMSRVSVSFYQQSKQLSEMKTVRPDVSVVYSQVFTDVLRRVDKAFRAFFGRVRRRERPGFPRFRSVSQYDSLTYPQFGFSVDGRKLILTKVGSVKIKLHRSIVGKVKTLTIKRVAGKWFALFSVEVSAAPLPKSDESVGIDVGLTQFATMSDGTTIANPRYARLAEAKMRRAQRRMARRRKGSSGRKAAIRLLQVAQAHIRCQRSDFHHKLSRIVVDRYGFIVVEDLNFKGLAGGMLAKSVLDAGWSFFIEKLAYKAEHAGRTLVKIDPAGTSQTCTCGASVRKTLEQRWHVCQTCGLSAPRDHVSAQVILGRGLRLWDSTWASTPCVS